MLGRFERERTRLAVGGAAGLELCAASTLLVAMLIVYIYNITCSEPIPQKNAYTEDVVIFSLKPRQAIIQGSFPNG